MNKYFILSLFLLNLALLNSEIITYDKVIKNMKGIKSYEKQEFDKAEKEFNENAMKNPHEGSLYYNQADALYKSGKLEDAENSYNLALRDKNFKNRSKALQNLGNVKFEQKDYKNAIKNYRDALIEDPNNFDARYNYELAARFLQRQQQQQQNQEQDKDDKDKKKQEKQDKQEQKENKEDQKKEQKEQQKQQDKKEEEKQKQEQKKMEKEKDKKKEDADKMLKMLLQKEKEEMKKEKMKLNADKDKSGKYW